MIYKAYEAYEVVASIWVWIPCIAGTPERRINEKLGAETCDLAMTYKLEVVVVGLCCHDVGNGDGFSWKWNNDNELWDMVVVRNLFVRCGSFSCLVSTAAAGQQFVDREECVFYAKSLEMFKKVTGAAHAQVDSSWHAGENAFLRSAGNAMDAKLCKERFVYINAWRNITTDTIENNHLAVYDETSLVSPDDYLDLDLFLPGARLMQYGLSNQNAAKHRWYNFPKMQLEEVLLFKQFESDTALPGRMAFHTNFVDPTVRPDAPERQSIECRAFLYFLDFEPNICPALPSDAVAKEVAFSHRA